MSPALLLLTYSGLVVAASLVGGWLPLAIRLTHTRLQVMMSLVAGLMLGVALYHLLPHAAAYLGSIDQAVGWTMVGLLTMFFLIRGFHSHQHIAPSEGQSECETTHDHDHVHEGHAHGSAHGRANLGWLGVALGLSLHTLIDGTALAAAVLAESSPDRNVHVAGLATFLAVLLHKPLDALSITTLMTADGRSLRLRQLVNAGFSLMCPLGAAAMYLGAAHLGAAHDSVLGAALGFAAGVFLCISLGDLMPEVEYHSHDRLKLSAALLVGVALAIGVGYLEPEHAHLQHSSGGEHTEHGHRH